MIESCTKTRESTVRDFNSIFALLRLTVEFVSEKSLSGGLPVWDCFMTFCCGVEF